MIATVWEFLVTHRTAIVVVYLIGAPVVYLTSLRVDGEMARPPHNRPRLMVGGMGLMSPSPRCGPRSWCTRSAPKYSAPCAPSRQSSGWC